MSRTQTRERARIEPVWRPFMLLAGGSGNCMLRAQTHGTERNARSPLFPNKGQIREGDNVTNTTERTRTLQKAALALHVLLSTLGRSLTHTTQKVGRTRRAFNQQISLPYPVPSCDDDFPEGTHLFSTVHPLPNAMLFLLYNRH